MNQNPSSSSTGTLKDRVFVKDGDGLQKVLMDDIHYISSEHVYITLHTRNRRFVIRDSLQHFMTELNCESFIRVHRSYVVNIEKVDKITHAYLMVDGNEVPLSKNYREVLLSRLHIK